ncbi:MAG: polysaccharide pyruvyl transferase family protein [Clostridiales bacterium]|nr:polysaccharide pyruvyl transferase family protein [Clostridiales bacterium]
MNILIDAYLDRNFGDDIMVETLIDYLQNNNNCFLIASNEFTYGHILKKFPKLKIVKSCNKEIIIKNKIECYIKIGGSMFKHNTIKEGIFRILEERKFRVLKKNRVKICILNCNVGPFKSKIGVRATRRILKSADLVTCRDKESYEYITNLRKINTYLLPDIVFSRTDLKQNIEKDRVLGISAYTEYLPKIQNCNLSYATAMAGIANEYLEKIENGKVKIFIFDTNICNDFPTAYEIYNQVKYSDKVEIVPYMGSTDTFVSEFNKCSVMIGARFHSIVLAILCGIPVLPVIYSNKTQNFLDDMNYNGKTLDFDQCSGTNYAEYAECLIYNSGIYHSIDLDEVSNSCKHFDVLEKVIL